MAKISFETEMDVLRVRSEGLRSRLQAAVHKVGFDMQAAEKDLLAIQSGALNTLPERCAVYRAKYEPAFRDVLSASGISVPDERAAVLSALNIRRSTSEPADSLGFALASGHRQADAVGLIGGTRIELDGLRGGGLAPDYNYLFEPRYSSGVIWGDDDGTSPEERGLFDLNTGNMSSRTGVVWGAAHRDKGAEINVRFEWKLNIRRIRVILNLDPAGFYVGALASLFGYASAEVFLGVRIVSGSITWLTGAKSLARAIALAISAPGYSEIGPRIEVFDFTRPDDVFWHARPSRDARMCDLGVSSQCTAGCGGLAAAAANCGFRMRSVRILGWSR